MQRQQIDISGTLAGQISVTPPEAPEDAALRRRKDWTVFVVVIGAIILIAMLAAYEGFFDGAASAATQQWGRTLLSSLFTGGISFVVGQKLGER